MTDTTTFGHSNIALARILRRRQGIIARRQAPEAPVTEPPVEDAPGKIAGIAQTAN